MEPHTDASFNWKFDGFGKTFCLWDGEPRWNDADNMCTPPFAVHLPDEGNHTLVVTLVVRACLCSLCAWSLALWLLSASRVMRAAVWVCFLSRALVLVFGPAAD